MYINPKSKFNAVTRPATQKSAPKRVSYTTGVSAIIGAKQMLEVGWKKPGVGNIEQHAHDTFMADLNVHGQPWQFIEFTLEKAAGFAVALDNPQH